jgi:hypothetical protein
MGGWVKLHRSIRDHWLYSEKPFSKLEAWIDLLLSANHKDNKFLLGNELIEVKRGSFVTSEVKLAEKWGWSRTKVRTFLELLEKDNMLVKKSDNKKTVLTIVNYSDYQDTETAKEQQKDSKKTAEEHQKNTNKNVKNDKNDKKKVFYAEFVSMTEIEYQKLVAEHGELATKEMIKILDNYKGSKGKTYKNDYRAILTWVVSRYEEDQKKRGGGTIENGGNKKPSKYAHIVNSYEPDPNLKFDDPDIF